MSTKFKKKEKYPEVDINLYIFANDGDDKGLVELLQMFYRGAFTNSIGIMRGYNTATSKTETLIVGLEVDGEKTELLPLAKVIDPSEAANYLSPNGKGGFFEREE